MTGNVGLILKSRLNEIDGLWLIVECGCGRSVVQSLKLMVQKFGRLRPLGSILTRLTCRQCGAKSAEVWLSETPNRTTNYGASPGWSVQVWPVETRPGVP